MSPKTYLPQGPHLLIQTCSFCWPSSDQHMTHAQSFRTYDIPLPISIESFVFIFHKLAPASTQENNILNSILSSLRQSFTNCTSKFISLILSDNSSVVLKYMIMVVTPLTIVMSHRRFHEVVSLILPIQ